MEENDIGFLPVIDDGKLVGVMSERDLVRRVRLKRSPFVHEIMKTRVHTVPPEASVPECLALMHAEHVRHLPVVSGKELLGVLSVRDLTGALIERHERLLRRLADERVTLLFPSGNY
jgi:CBS domain-containing protein